MSCSSFQLSPNTQAILAKDALSNQPSVRLVRLPLMPSDAECVDHGIEEGPDDEPPSKKKKIIPYKLKDSDKKMIYESGTVIYTEEFKRSVWDYLLTHTLAQGELRYPEISHSVLYKWRRKALEEKGAFVPQRNVESRKSLLADLKKDKDDDDEKHRRYSEPPKVPKLKISLKLTKEEPKVKLIPALSDDLSVDKKVRVVVFALQNSTQKAAEHFSMRAGEVHSYMSQNVIRRMALDRIRNKVSKCSKGDEKTKEQMEEIVNLARRTNVERAARQYGVREGQVLQWMRSGIPTRPTTIQYKNGTVNGTGETKSKDYSIEFQMKVLDLARKQSLSRACKVFQIQPSLAQEWMRQFFPEEEVHKVVSHDAEAKVRREEVEKVTPVDADELETLLYERLQQPSSRIRALDTGEMAMDTVVSVLKVALTAGSKVASIQFNIPRTTIATWITRNALEELTRGNKINGSTRRVSTTPPQSSSHVSNGSVLSPIRTAREARALFRASFEPPSPISTSVPMANGDQLEIDELMDSNNNLTFLKEEADTTISTQTNGIYFEDDGKTVKFTAEQLEKAQELGITMKCLQRWLECREHFVKLRKGRLDSAYGDSLREILTFRLEAVDYAQKEGRVFAASVFRVTLTELNEWNKRRDSYMKVLLNAPIDNSMALEVIDKSDLIIESEQKERAQTIADRLGLDLNAATQFIQQLYASY